MKIVTVDQKYLQDLKDKLDINRGPNPFADEREMDLINAIEMLLYYGYDIYHEEETAEVDTDHSKDIKGVF